MPNELNDVSEALTAITTYFKSKPSTAAQPQQPLQSPLKHFEMWTHFEKLMEKLDEDDISDLNFEFTKVIHAALKEARNRK